MPIVAIRLLGCPVYDRIEIREVLETGTRMNQFRTGQFDIISGSRDLLDQAKAAGASVYYKPDGNMVGLYFFQTYRKDNVFHDVRVRQAAAYAIDHKLIAEAVWNGVGLKPWGCSWPPSTEISTQEPAVREGVRNALPLRSEEGARAVGRRRLSPPARRPTIRLEYNVSYPEEPAFAEAMQQMMNAVGFNANVARVTHHRAQSPTRREEHVNSHPVLRLRRALYVARGLLFRLRT